MSRATDVMIMLANYRSRPAEENFQALGGYKVVLRALVASGALRRCHMVFRGPAPAVEHQGDITVHVVPSFAAMPGELLTGDLLLVRADRSAYLPVLARGRYGTRMFYPASSTFFPRRTGGYDVLFADEPDHVAWLQRRFRGPHCAVWPKSADPSVFHPIEDSRREFDVVLFGHMDAPAKNYRALAPIIFARPKLRYLIIGRQDPELSTALASTGARVHFTGALTPREANAWLARARVALTLSERDGAPRTLLELMAAGLPQIVNARLRAGTRYVLEGTGHVAPLEDVPLWIDRVLSQPNAYDPRGIFEQNFHPSVAAELLMEAVRRARTTSPTTSPLLLRLLHSKPGSWINSRLKRKLLRDVRGDHLT